LNTPCLFGAIADDYTGGSDLAGMLRERGVRTVQLFGVPDTEQVERIAGKYDAVVLCLKSRAIEPETARLQSLDALQVLRTLGARQVQFKYCSTFDSTVKGNIGPVIDALLEALGAPFTVAVPALPVNGRTQYLGYLFVGGQLLSESPMRDHPVNPMKDPNLVRHLQAQTKRRCGLVELPIVDRGPQAVAFRMEELQREGIEIALVDAVTEFDLEQVAEAVADMPLITGGSGLAMALPRLWRIGGSLPPHHSDAAQMPGPGGVLILSGSCSTATLDQLHVLDHAGYSAMRMDVRSLTSDTEAEAARLAESARDMLAARNVAVIRSSASPDQRSAAIGGLDVSGEAVSAVIERCFGMIAQRVIDSGAVNRLIVAGGETSGSVINALGIRAAEVTGVIDPGVPGLRTLAGRPLWLALKSGNFGAPDFFLKTMRYWNRNE
jgi:3-dehydrotetronate 4-kinase